MNNEDNALADLAGALFFSSNLKENGVSQFITAPSYLSFNNKST